MSNLNENSVVALTHAGGGILGFIPSLIVMLAYQTESEYVKNQVKAALNFQLTILLLIIVVSVVLSFLSLLVTPLIGIANLVICIIAAIATKEGGEYKYPFSLNLVK